MSLEAEYTLENEILKVTARSYGGEMRSITEFQKSFWQMT